MNEGPESELITHSEAARRLGKSRQWLSSLIRRGRIRTVVVAGIKLVRLIDVLNYEPGKAGRKRTRKGIKSAARKGNR